MELITQLEDIRVFYVTASSFPEGVLQAHQKLHALIPYSAERKYFGISRPEEGVITYRAAAEELKPGEGEALECESLVLQKGNYISLTIQDYMKDLSGIGRAFSQLLEQPGLDPQGYCVEWYLSDKDVRCMIRLAEKM